MKKQKILQMAAFLAAAAVSMASCSSGGPETGGAAVDTYKLEKQDIENDISVSGRVEGSDIGTITTDLTAKVKTLNVELGSSVKKRDDLWIFDSSE